MIGHPPFYIIFHQNVNHRSW